MSYYHEAAHYVVARHFGLDAEISMKLGPKAPAHWGAAASHSMGTNVQNAMVSFAGEIVEEVTDTRLAELGRVVRREGIDPELNLSDDTKHAYLWCLRDVGDDPEKAEKATDLANTLLEETRELVLKLWGEIAEVAEREFQKEGMR